MIPILYEVVLGTKAILVMPERFILPDVAHALGSRKTSAIISRLNSEQEFDLCTSKPWLTLTSSQIIFSLH